MTLGATTWEGGSFLRRPLWNCLGFAEIASENHLDHIVVIAGPTGSGKSTLLREFLSERLPKEISDFLPEAARTWQFVNGNEVSRKGIPRILRSNGQPSGLVVHYDIMRVYTRGFEQYGNDPAIQTVLGAGVALTVLTLLPSREELFDQFLKRARNDEYEEPWERKKWSRRFRRGVRRGLQRFTGQKRTLLTENHIRLLGVYGSERRLEQWTARWEDFLDKVCRQREDVALLYVTPVSPQDGHPRFRPLCRARAA